MAWRLNKCIVRGEIDNTEKGRVRGRIWLVGREQPLRLELQGNGHRDVAGCKLSFDNKAPETGEPTNLQDLQEGVIGDMTASRRVRVLDVSVEEAMQLSKAGEPVPEHTGNCLYLEWFSRANGRVVVETVDFDVSVSDRAWDMSVEEERVQIDTNRQAIRDWLDRLSSLVEDEEGEETEFDEGEDQPMDEFQWEQFLRESDELTDKYSAALEKYRDHPDCERLVAREMGWTWLEEALEAEARGALSEDELYDAEDEDADPLTPNPLTEGVDWIRDDSNRIQHPLTARAHRVAMSMWHQCDQLGLLGDDGDEDIGEMVFQAQTLSAKLAGALNHLAYEHEREPGFVVACLKRALGYLHESLAASDKVRSKATLQDSLVIPFRRNLFEIREQVLGLMDRFRKKQW